MAEDNARESITAEHEVDEEEKREEENEIPKKMNPILWLLGKRPTYQRRHIRANNHHYNIQWNYFGNSITTSRYNIITFLPKNLFEQFQRVANIYFTVLLILQLIPQISSLTPITTILPLLFVLGTTLIKDGVDDLFRHVSDYKINNRLVKVCCQLSVRYTNTISVMRKYPNELEFRIMTSLRSSVYCYGVRFLIC